MCEKHFNLYFYECESLFFFAKILMKDKQKWEYFFLFYREKNEGFVFFLSKCIALKKPFLVVSWLLDRTDSFGSQRKRLLRRTHNELKSLFLTTQKRQNTSQQKNKSL
ncbi:hypothetical protein CLAVI_000132 [Candidatus Clavichlamydia salmonicola]|nr:hypothetical protein [Candidatus Clavichlamydia salmonicola]